MSVWTFVILCVLVGFFFERPGASLATLLVIVILSPIKPASNLPAPTEEPLTDSLMGETDPQEELRSGSARSLDEASESATIREPCSDESMAVPETIPQHNGTLVGTQALATASLESPKSALATQINLLVTVELEEALDRCGEKVGRISKECRKDNRKFRDIEFDLENDSKRCYFGIDPDPSEKIPNVKRVSEIFENPQFFIDGPGSSDVVQGALGDCWFLSALSALATSPGMIEKVCVARDEVVGVYGFVFFRDNRWVDVIIDDQLFWSPPKYEELKKEEQELYHEDKDLYNKLTTGNGRGLHFARSETNGETWVPLIEKAYAKLHGDYMSLAGGLMFEGLEDLSGGVSQITSSSDILDPERFWNEELSHANDKMNLFGVSLPRHDTARRGDSSTVFVRGLVDKHAYSVLRAKECKGKRFVVIRNPWGSFEWTGPWSDGSKEWTPEWYDVLKELDHVLGDDGEFVMEYSDFLDTWWLIQHVTIPDSGWIMSSYWLQMPTRPMDYPWTRGEVIFNFTLSKPSMTTIVLSQLDNRYFSDIDGRMVLSLDFIVYKRGETEPQGESYTTALCLRSVTCHLELDAGEYVVYPRIDRFQSREMGYFIDDGKEWDYRKLSQVLTQRTQSRSIAANYNIGQKRKFISTSLTRVIEQDLIAPTKDKEVYPHRTPEVNLEIKTEELPSSESSKTMAITGDDEDDTPTFVGLKVYTKSNALVTVTGHLRA